MNIYVLTIIDSYTESLLELDTFTFTSFEDAKKKFEEEESEWISYYKQCAIDNYDSEEDVITRIDDAINTNVGSSYGTTLYKHYCFEDGYEKVFSIEEFKIEI